MLTKITSVYNVVYCDSMELSGCLSYQNKGAFGQSEVRTRSRISKNARIKIRIRNETFETFVETLERFPDTLLGSFDKRIEYYDMNSDTFIFSPHITSFDAILYYYQSYGSLIRPPLISLHDFVRDCNYFELSTKSIARMKERDGFIDTAFLETNIFPEAASAKSWRSRLWRFVELPDSSYGARIFAVTNFILIAFSVLFACFITHPSVSIDHSDLFSDPYFLTEFALNSYFGLEYLFRATLTPNLLRFLVLPLSIVDFVAIFPYFIVLSIEAKQISTVSFLQILRILRVLRLFRLTKQSKTFRTVILILSRCIEDILMLFICFFIACVISASIQYHVECNIPGTAFNSIPQSMWWAIQTLVCLGYGDIVPISFWGKIVAAGVAILGAITLTVPLLSVGGKYLTLYAQRFRVPVGEDMDPREKTLGAPKKTAETDVAKLRSTSVAEH